MHLRRVAYYIVLNTPRLARNSAAYDGLSPVSLSRSYLRTYDGLLQGQAERLHNDSKAERLHNDSKAVNSRALSAIYAVRQFTKHSFQFTYTL